MLRNVLNLNEDVLKKAMDIAKAVNSPDAGFVSGVAGIIEQPEVQRAVSQLVDRRNPLRQNMPRIPGAGAQFSYTYRVPGTTAAAFVNETEEPVRSAGARDKFNFTYKTLLARGRVGRLAQRIGSSLLDLLADEMEQRAEDFRDFEDQQIIRGDAAANSKAYDGIDRILGLKGLGGSAGTTFTSQVIVPSVTNLGVTGTTLTGNLMDRLVDAVTMDDPNFILASRAGKRSMLKLLHALGQAIMYGTVNGGFSMPTWAGIPIYVSTNIADVCVSNGSTYSAYTGGTMSTIYCGGWNTFFMSVLTELQTMALAQISSQYVEFDMFCDEVVVLRKYGGLAALSHINPLYG